MQNHDIIAAIATPPGKGSIGVVRISGKDLKPVANEILGFIPRERNAQLCNFYDQEGQVIDQGIALYFPAPNSYTGEDVLELQGHGGSAIMNLLLSRCISVGTRLAEPGEFTLRAFLNNKLDLVQAEGIADIINATTNQAARCAVRSLQGDFSIAIHALVASITNLRILIEATLDFPEEDTAILLPASPVKQIDSILAALEQVFVFSRQGNLLREGITVVLVGEPNVGKSSLMNRLAGEEVAIVTEIPGTTRDTIHQTIQIEGVPLHLIDTAGLRETTDIVELSGIQRTYAAIKKADMVILLIDLGSKEQFTDDQILKNIPPELPLLTVYNKIDLLNKAPKAYNEKSGPVIHLSAKEGSGIALLRKKLLDMAGWQSNDSEEGLFMARQRHLQSLINAKKQLENARSILSGGQYLELAAEELRLSQQSLTSITGEFTADDLLGQIFSSFCIGK